MMNEKNSKEDKKFTIAIAHGYSLCENLSSDGIEATIAKADSAMYENKAMLKGIGKA